MIRDPIGIEKLFTRDNIVWTLGFMGSVLAYAAAHTSLIPAGHAEQVKDWATLIGFISGKLGWSPLATSDKIQEIK